jgi:phosphoribosyl-ATP pyrophosphohydrolase
LTETSLGAELERLWQTIEARKDADPASSYTSKLLAGGIARPAQKLGEEAVEAVIAAVSKDAAELTKEAADVLYHLLVVLAAAGVDPKDVATELERRTGQSGLDEKASR